MEIKHLTSLREFIDIEEEYDSLLSKSNGKFVYVTPDYLIPWLTTIGKGLPLDIITMRKQGELVSLCVMVESPDWLEKRRTVFEMAGRGLWGYSMMASIPRYDDIIIPTMVSEIIKTNRTDTIEIGPYITKFQVKLAMMGVKSNLFSIQAARFIQLGGCPIIQFRNGAGSWDNFTENLNSQHSVLKKLKTSTRNLEKLGKIEYLFLEPKSSMDAVITTVTSMIDMHTKEWGVKSRFVKRPIWKDLYIDFAYRASQKGFLDFTMLILNDEPIAYHYGFLHNSTLYYFTPTYDTDYSRYSPGSILMYRLINRAYSNLAEFDFQNEVEPYKTTWATGMYERAALRILSEKRLIEVTVLGRQAPGHQMRIVPEEKRKVTQIGGIDVHSEIS